MPKDCNKVALLFHYLCCRKQNIIGLWQTRIINTVMDMNITTTMAA